MICYFMIYNYILITEPTSEKEIIEKEWDGTFYSTLYFILIFITSHLFHLPPDALDYWEMWLWVS